MTLGLLAAAMASAPSSFSSPEITPEEARFLIREGERWLQAERAAHRPAARPLSAGEIEAFSGFFTPEVLTATRVAMVERIENPPFYRLFDETGRPYPIDFRAARAVAIIDTILVVESRRPVGEEGWRTLLFHELVHHAQRAVMGEDYLAHYVCGWLENGREYRTIPIEAQAFDLSRRYRDDPHHPFPVEPEVRKLLENRPGQCV